jgi:hypothetical protein
MSARLADCPITKEKLMMRFMVPKERYWNGKNVPTYRKLVVGIGQGNTVLKQKQR